MSEYPYITSRCGDWPECHDEDNPCGCPTDEPDEG